MQLPATTRVLVVGAGPTGLASAISLIIHGVKPEDVLIVDNAVKGENTSRAIAIHAATLEALDTIGCADKIVQNGLKLQLMQMRHRSAPFLTNDFSYLEPYTKFPFILTLAQTVTEEILEERLTGLGVEVKRPFRMVGMKPSESGSGLDATFESGEVIKADFVIGADGARSVVRQLSGIGFTDPDGQPAKQSVNDRVSQLVLGDVLFSSPLRPEDLAGVLSSAGMCLVMPLGSPSASSTAYGSTEPVYRIVMNMPMLNGPPPSNPPLEFLQEWFNKQGPLALSSDPVVNPNPVKITKLFWSSRFRTHSAVADTFFKRVPGEGAHNGGVVMLVGDAAHIHSPIGGQGMNLGLRDAIALGGVLAERIRPNDDDFESGLETLRDFASSRREKALNVIHLTKRGMSVMSFATMPSFGLNVLVSWFLRLLWKIPAVRRKAVWQLSGLGNR